MTRLAHPVEMTVDAPDGAAAMELERLLAHLAPVSVAHAGRWSVTIPAVETPAEVEATVAAWLAAIGAETTTVRTEGRAARVHARPSELRRHRASNERFVG